MPTLSMFFGIIIEMYFFDNEQHYKPHIHAKYAEYTAAIGLDGELLGGSLPRKQFRLVLAWLVIHEEELYRCWTKAIRGEGLSKIEPLK